MAPLILITSKSIVPKSTLVNRYSLLTEIMTSKESLERLPSSSSLLISKLIAKS